MLLCMSCIGGSVGYAASVYFPFIRSLTDAPLDILSHQCGLVHTDLPWYHCKKIFVDSTNTPITIEVLLNVRGKAHHRCYNLHISHCRQSSVAPQLWVRPMRICKQVVMLYNAFQSFCWTDLDIFSLRVRLCYPPIELLPVLDPPLSLQHR